MLSYTTQPSVDGSSAVNEDSIGDRLLAGVVVVVADSVGGFAGGAPAGRLAVDEILGSAAILAKAEDDTVAPAPAVPDNISVLLMRIWSRRCKLPPTRYG